METFSFNKLRFAVGLVAFLWLASVTVQDNRELKTNRHEVAIEATEFGMTRRLGPPVVLPLRYVSMPQVCEAILRQGLRSPPAV